MESGMTQAHFDKIVAKMPGAKGGIISPDGQVLYTTDPDVTDAIRGNNQIFRVIEKGARIFVPIDIRGCQYFPHSGGEIFDDIAVFNGERGGGVLAFYEDHTMVIFSPEVDQGVLNTQWHDIMKQSNDALKQGVPI